jgi:hypothetical protein
VGVAAALGHEEISFRRDFRTVIDVNVHTGQFALFAAANFPSARLYCIEPLVSARTKLHRVAHSDGDYGRGRGRLA